MIDQLPSPASDSSPEPISPIDPHLIRHERDDGEMLLPSPVSDDEDVLDDFCVSFDKAGVTRQPSNSSFFDNVYLDSRHSFPRPVSTISGLSVVVVKQVEQVEEFKTKPLMVKKRAPARPVHPFAAVQRQDSTASAHRAITESFMAITPSPPIFSQPLPPVPKRLPPSPSLADELAGLAIRRPSFPAPLPSLPSTPASSRRYDLPMTPRTPASVQSRRWDSPVLPMTPTRAPNKAARLLGVDTPPVPSPPSVQKMLKVSKKKEPQLTSNRLIELQSLLDSSPPVRSVHAWKQIVDDQEFASLLPKAPPATLLAPPIQLSVNGRVRPAQVKPDQEQGQSLSDFFKGEDDVALRKAARAKALARARGDFTDSEDEDVEDLLDDKPRRTTGGRSALAKRLGVSMDELEPAMLPRPKRPPRPEVGPSTSLPNDESPLVNLAPKAQTPSPPRPKHRPPPLNLTRLPPQRGLPIINVVSPSEVVAARMHGHRPSRSDPVITPTCSTPSSMPVSAGRAQTPFAHPRAAPVPAMLRPTPQQQHRSVSTSAVRTVPHPSLAAPPVAMPRSVSDSGPYAFVSSRPSVEVPRRSTEHVDENGEPISFFEASTPTDVANGKAARTKAWAGIKRAVRL